MSTEEEALTGGFVPPVVKAGNTVRRRSGPWTSTVQRLLTHVRARGLGWLPCTAATPSGSAHGRRLANLGLRGQK